MLNPLGGRADRPIVPSELAHLTGAATPESLPSTQPSPSTDRCVTALFADRAEAKVLFDASGVVAFASGATLALLGLDAVQLGGTPSAKLPPTVGKPLTQIAHQAFVNRTVGENELAVTRFDGRAVALKLKASPMVENDAVLGVGVSIRDAASPRVLSCAEAGDLAAALEAAKFSPFAVFFLDSRGNCLATNDLWSAATGLTEAASRAQGWLAAFDPATLDSFRRLAVAAHRASDGWRTELGAKNGASSFDAAAAPVFDEQRSIVGYVAFLMPTSNASYEPQPSATWVAAGAPVVAAAVEVAPVVAVVEVAPVAPVAQVAPKQMPPPSLSQNVLSDIGSGISTTAPVQPVEKHSLRIAADGPNWRPPTIEAGFTDPSLLVASRAAEVQSSAVISEPGTDRVTGLPNRLLFAQHVAATIERIKSDALTVAVSFVDLRGIRAQRQRAGTRVANDSLFLLAKRLESTIRSIEIAGAVSEDVFAVLSINWLFAEDLPIVARRLLGRLEEPLAGRDGEFVVEMQLGMSVARAGDTVEALFARAEKALVEATQSPDHYFIEGL